MVGEGPGALLQEVTISSITFLSEANDKQVEGGSSHHMDLQQQC